MTTHMVALVLAAGGTLVAAAQEPADPYLWLENVEGDQALRWVHQHDAITQREIESSPVFKPVHDRILAVYTSQDRIPYVSKHGGFYYNFWQDAEHVRGIWRRTTPAEYRKPLPAWETVIDVDQLAAAQKAPWVWKGASFLEPTNDRCLVHLSRGGGDTTVVREFDPVAKAFVANGFVLAEAHNRIVWRDRDHVFVGTDFGPGSLTTSLYPRVVKTWKRGTPLSAATVVFEGQAADVSVDAWRTDEPGFEREFVLRGLTFFTAEHYLVAGDQTVRLDLPDDAQQGSFRDQITVTLRTDWTVSGRTFPAGAMLALPWKRFLAGDRDFATLFEPGPRKALGDVAQTRDAVIIDELDNLHNHLFVLEPQADGTWSRTAVAAPEFGSIAIEGVDLLSNDYFVTTTNFLTPTTLSIATAGKPGIEPLKQLPSFFATEGLEISQHEVTSKDGTRVPYFQVSKKGVVLDGSNPTLLYGYGGFEISMLPGYNSALGIGWLESGGIYILANIRGGGEFGPKWHEAGLKEHRQRVYDDFISIAEDLVARKVTTPKKLGIMGGSNGGLLMGVMLTQRPDLFGAVVCQIPLLDMRRYNKLLVGASWMGEYGNPDLPQEWAYISRYSPYQNLKPGVRYPRVLFFTSTRDDRVHPGHARKMAAKMEAQGDDLLYYEDTEGGHSAGANAKQQAYMWALTYTFLREQLNRS